MVKMGPGNMLHAYRVNHTLQLAKSQRSNPDVPDDAPVDQPLHTTIDHNPNNNTIDSETSQPVPASVVQMHAAVESAMIDTHPSTSRRPKQTIRLRLYADQVEISDNNCANLVCDNPKRPGELLKCSSLGCRSKVCTPCCVGRVLN
jgi:hypothetical protein